MAVHAGVVTVLGDVTPEFERYRIPELKSFNGWRNEFATGGGGGRKLQQASECAYLHLHHSID